jgi:hypothetical protein
VGVHQNGGEEKDETQRGAKVCRLALASNKHSCFLVAGQRQQKDAANASEWPARLASASNTLASASNNLASASIHLAITSNFLASNMFLSWLSVSPKVEHL